MFSFTGVVTNCLSKIVKLNPVSSLNILIHASSGSSNWFIGPPGKALVFAKSIVSLGLLPNSVYI